MSNTLVELRQQIDEIDKALLDLVKMRLNLSHEVIAAKTADSPVYRPAREALLMQKLLLQLNGEFEKEVISKLWRLLLAASVHSQRPDFKIVSLSGLEDFTNQFSVGFLKFEICQTEEELITNLSNNKADIAFLPFKHLSKISKFLGEETGLYLNHKLDDVAIICKNTPEETGSDVSVFKDINLPFSNIIEKQGFALNSDDKHVFIGGWVNI